MSTRNRNRRVVRTRLHERIRKKVEGTKECPRLCVHFSDQHIYAQVIDDVSRKTLLAVATTEKSFKGKNIRPNVKGAAEVGKMIADRAKEKGVSEVVFDRGGFKYHGKVKALADAAREGGLRF